MKRGIVRLVRASTMLVLLVGITPVLAPQGAAAAEKTVAEEILDILRDRGQITEEQYEVLSVRAREEGAATPDVAAGNDWTVKWKDGLRVESADDKFKIKIGGRMMADWAYFNADDDVAAFFGDPDLDGGSGTEIRRARLFVSGLLYERVKFKAQYEFSGDEPDIKDMYVELTKIPAVGNVRVGHFKEPFSLEEQMSSKYMTFMERSLATQAFAPSRNAGVFVHDHALDKRLTWAVGAFRDTDDNGFDFGEDEVWGVSGRVSGVPWYENEGERLLHLGLSYSHRFSDSTLRYRARPEAHLSPVRFVDTGSFVADDADIFNPEVALVLGPFSFQGEYFHALVDSETQSDPDLTGYYAAVSYFLTGEHRKYKLGSGKFGRVRPKQNFDLSDGGLGAWQIAARYSSIDLADGNLSTLDVGNSRAREAENITVGLNWHLNPNLRMMFNYVWSDLEDLDSTDILQTRIQLDF